jgi:phosphoribosylaminoimidazole (AIR) synthetase
VRSRAWRRDGQACGARGAVIKKILDKHRQSIHGIIHCSGGAQTKALHFIENVHVVKDNMFPVPPLFKMIHEQSQTDYKEMYKVCSPALHSASF